jgi:hypothetical protein
MKAEHMPYYRGPHILVEHCPAGTSTDEFEDTIADDVATTLIASIITQGDMGHASFCVHPVRFWLFSSTFRPEPVRALYNNEFPALAYRAMNYSWAVYGFNSGHFCTSHGPVGPISPRDLFAFLGMHASMQRCCSSPPALKEVINRASSSAAATSLSSWSYGGRPVWRRSSMTDRSSRSSSWACPPMPFCHLPGNAGRR